MANISSIFLRHARIADRYRDALQRKLKDVVDCSKCGGHRKIGLTRLLQARKG